jgi:hypothetical protein
MDVPVVLLDPGLNGTAGLPSVVLIAFTGNAVNARCLVSQAVLQRPEETDSSSARGPQTWCCAWTEFC